MSENKFTPGPWTAETYLLGAFDICAEKTVGGCIVLASRSRHETRSDEMHANARLIAAAPELYEAAEEALNVLIGCAIPAGGVDDRKHILNAQAMLRAALSKVSHV